MNKSQFMEKWRTCRLCPLHKTAKHHAIYRGSIPANILFIGEAPGRVENEIGKPFVGPSGQLLNKMLLDLSVTSYCITNITCCIPYAHTPTNTVHPGEDRGVRPPSNEEAAACYPHLLELHKMVQPLVVVAIGRQAQLRLRAKDFPGSALGHIEHPASILRHGGTSSANYKKALVDLQDFLLQHGAMLKPMVHFVEPIPRVIYIGNTKEELSL